MKQRNPPPPPPPPPGAPAPPASAWLPLRGPSGRLYGYYNPAGQIIEVKRKGEPPEVIELSKIAHAKDGV